MEREIVERINSVIDSKRKEIIEFATLLVKESSETPPGDERGVCKLIRKKSFEWKLPKPEIWAKKPTRPNLIYRLRGEESRKILVLNGHIDTKPIGDVSKWSVDPYNPKIINGRLYGRGSTDMKGGMVGMLAAVWAISSCKIPLKGDLILALTADEEGGGIYGAKVLIEKGLEADAIIIGEPSGEKRNFDSLGLACRGALLGEVVVYGTQMHSSLSDKGGCINASVKMAEVMIEFARNLKKNLNYKPHYLYPNGPTVNPGVTLSGGIFYGVIPGEASFGFDLRTIPGMTFEEVRKDIEDFLRKLKEKDNDLNVKLVLEKPPLVSWIPPAEIKKDHLIVLSCTEATKNIIGLEPKLVGVPFGTDACFLANELDIPTIPSFGPGFVKLAHGPNEYVNVDSIIDSAKIYALCAIKYLNI